MITIDNIHIQFEGKTILRNFSAEIKKGEKVVFTGESGTGKTTLINTILGFVRQDKGKINILGYDVNEKNIKKIRENIAYVPQEINPPFSKAESILYEPFSFRQNKDRLPSFQEINNTLSYLGLSTEILQKGIDEISGGQKQRLYVAAAFLLKKSIIIMDEPTTGLDEKNIIKISKWISEQKNLTVLAASHNAAWIKHSDKIFNLEQYGTNS